MRAGWVASALCAFAVSWHADASAQCSGGGTRGAFGSSEYIFCQIGTDWNAAKVDCETGGTDWSLTRIDHAYENNFARGLGAGNAWMGASDQVTEGQWVWPDGAQFWQGDDGGSAVGGLYNNWDTNNEEPGSGDCGRMDTASTWDARGCSNPYAYICEGPPVCGNGVRGAGEECDDGNTADGDGCSATCTLEGPPVCGDGFIWEGEACDDDNTASGDGCSSTCEVEVGFTCTGQPSQCTAICSGGLTWKRGLTTTEYLYCNLTTNGASAREACDGIGPGWSLTRIDDVDENTYVTGFSGSAKWIGANDGAVEDTWVWPDGEQFWQGDENGSPVGGLYNNWNSGQPNNISNQDCAEMQSSGGWTDISCTSTRRYVCEGPPICGNGVVATPEECDDGNTADGDGCSATCTLEAPPPCGDGRIWLGEECDDGDGLGGDGCSSTCQIEPGYTCTGEPSTCTPVCSGSFDWRSQMGSTTTEYFLCEESITAVEAETICEGLGSGWTLTRIDDATENTYIDGLIGEHLWIGGQDEAVESAWRWRDGDQFWSGDENGSPVGGLYTNWDPGQEPDGGTDENCARQEDGGLWQDRDCTDTNRFVCEGPPICGNGVTTTPEECDDGNTADGDGCSATCTLEGPAPCGDGRIWLGEECDDGDALGGDGCSSTCQVEPGYTCTGEPSTCTPICTGNFEWRSRMGSTTTEYFLCEQSHTASAAETICEGLGPGWSLTRIDDVDENTYVAGFSGSAKWIGANDQGTEGVWVWPDGAQFWQGDENGSPVGGLYNNWNSGQPNNWNGTQDCAEMQSSGGWTDISCTSTRQYVCEGQPICGNGAVAMPELCDDGNTMDGDGCSSSCTVESSYECFLPDDLGTPSVCQISADVVVGRVELLEVRGRPVLQWETTSQSGTLGFVVSRQVRHGWKPLHEGILLALPGAPQGGVYSLQDTGASIRRPVSYRLEEIEIDGARKPIGEWQLVARPASAPVLWESDYEAVPHALVPRRVDASAGFARKSHTSVPATRAVLDVAQDGAVEVSVTTLAELFAKSPGEVRGWAIAGDVRITDQAYQVPWWFDEARDSLVVVGRSPTSVYDAGRKYVLRNATGRQMLVESRETPATPVGTGTTRHVVDSNVFPALVVSPDPESDYWFAASLSARASGFGQYETDISLPDAAVEAAVLRVHLYGGWNLSDETAQRVVIHVNGVPVDTVEVTAIGPHVFEMAIDPTVLYAGNNRLLLVAESEVPAAVSGLYVDRFELEVDRVLATAQAELEFTALETGPLTVEVAATSAHVLDTTGHKKVEATVVTDTEFGIALVSFEAEQDHSYLVFEEPRAPSAMRGAVDFNAPPSGASYVVITPAAWTDAAERFAALHAAEGLSTAVVSIESLYDAYGNSVATPHAIHDFLVDADAQWADKPRFVLLLGDGTLDYRNLMGIGPGAIAPRMVQTKGGLYASDALLGDLDDDGLADVAVGRIPAQTLDEAVAAFEAVQTYQELEFDDFGLAALMISGMNRGANFAGAIDDLQQMFPPALETRSIRVDTVGVEQARDDLAIDLQRAPFWMHYTGHGGLDRFDDQGVLKSEDIPTLRPLLPPIVTGMTCATSRFELPGTDSLAEHMVDPANAFAIASWGPSGLTMSHDAAMLGEAFATKLFSDDGATPRLGDLVVALHQEPAPAYNPDALAVYVLLGDPALRLKSLPEGSVVAPPVDPGLPPDGSAFTSLGSAAGCAVRFSRNQPSPLWLLLAVSCLVHRRRSRSA
ncbi:MAG: C25 family cysteine peptidase [Myxococcales bacterium]|nr:C25 family cysteine peptidase [Myxococcales bacterium]